MTIVILIIIVLMLGSINYQLYIAFFVPEQQRRNAFKKLSEQQTEELRQTMTADHFFRLQANAKLPIISLKPFTRKRI